MIKLKLKSSELSRIDLFNLNTMTIPSLTTEEEKIRQEALRKILLDSLRLADVLRTQVKALGGKLESPFIPK